MKTVFQKVTAHQILPLRHLVLRAGRAFSTAHFKGDDLDTTYHYAGILNTEIVGCVSLMKNTHPEFDDNKAYQLRGMAVSQEHRGFNIGRQLLAYAESQMKIHKVRLIWCNVRTSAEIFYTKNQYQKVGGIFEIADVGPHVLMFKKL